MYNDNRIVMTLDAGGTNLVFSAIRGGNEIVTPITLPSCACNLEQCLGQLSTGFSRIREQLTEAPVAISFAFPGPADYPAGIIGLSLIHISEPTRRTPISYAVFCLKKFFFLMIRRPPRSTP